MIETAAQALVRLSRVLERSAAPLSLADYRVLMTVAAGEERASRLAQGLAVGKPSISATVDSLARRGLISRGRVEADQRAVALSLTDAGRLAYEEAQGRMVERLREVLALTADPEASLRALVEVGDAHTRLRQARAAS